MQVYGTHNIFTHMETEDFEHIRRIKPGGGCKIVNPSGGHIRRILDMFPDCPVFVLRDHPLSEQHEDYKRNPAETGRRHAREIFNVWKRVYAEVGKDMLDREYWLEGINEPDLDAGDRNKMPYDEWLKETRKLSETLDTYTIEFVKELDRVVKNYVQGNPSARDTIFRAATYQFGVGWPANLKNGEPPYWGFFSNSIRVCEQYDAVSCFHVYFSKKGPDELGDWLAYRPQTYPGKNDVAFTEAGMDELTVNENLPHPEQRGFRNFVSTNVYAEMVNRHYKVLSEIFGDRFKGYYIFTADGASEWRTFWLHSSVHGNSAYPDIESKNWNFTPSPVDPPDPPDPVDPPEDGAILWPTKGVMTQRFGENVDVYHQKYGAYGHNGIDIANVVGTPVIAVFDGTVEWVDTDPEYGKYVRIFLSELGMHAFYAHLNQATVKRGDVVKKGDRIGYMGNTGNSTGPHLHFELRMGSRYTYKDVSYGHSKGRFNPEVILTWLGDKSQT